MRKYAQNEKKKTHNQGATFHMCAIGHPHVELRQTVSFSRILGAVGVHASGDARESR